MSLNAILITLVCVVAIGYYYLKKQFSYWSDRNVPCVRPEIPFGNIRGLGTKEYNAVVLARLYNQLKGKDVIGGVYYFTRPICVPLDLDVLRNILVKDFKHFDERGWYVNKKCDPLTGNLFFMHGDDWRTLRPKLSPTFTSGKLKMMHSIFIQVASELKNFLVPLADKSSEIEVREILARFTTDVIGNCAFGIECNSLKDPNSEFRRNGRKTVELSKLETLKLYFLIMFPEMGRKLNMRFFKPDVVEFFLKLLKDTVDYRERNNVHRNDFMSLLIQLKNTGKIDGEQMDLGQITFEELAAQIFVFFIAGYETSSTTMSYAIYELAQNKEIQSKVRTEVQAVLSKYNGNYSYEPLNEMAYLDQVIKETLRKYPVVDTLFRKARSKYVIPNTKHVLDESSMVMVPVFAIHRDPEIYPDPEKFDPDRFTHENISKRHPYAWLPFGEGPRNCIGMRFGLMQTKIGLATILANFSVEPTANTQTPIKFLPSSHLLFPETGIFLKIRNL